MPAVDMAMKKFQKNQKRGFLKEELSQVGNLTDESRENPFLAIPYTKLFGFIASWLFSATLSIRAFMSRN